MLEYFVLERAPHDWRSASARRCCVLLLVAAGYAAGFGQLAAAVAVLQGASDLPLQLSKLLLAGTPGSLREGNTAISPPLPFDVCFGVDMCLVAAGFLGSYGWLGSNGWLLSAQSTAASCAGRGLGSLFGLVAAAAWALVRFVGTSITSASHRLCREGPGLQGSGNLLC